MKGILLIILTITCIVPGVKAQKDTMALYEPSGIERKETSKEYFVLPEGAPILEHFEGDHIIKKMYYVKNNDQKEGTCLEFYPNKSIYKIMHYKKNVLDGAFLQYYDNGFYQIIGEYENGKKEGNWRFFSPDQKLIKVETYKNGEQIE